jgi:hypothetical protein
MVPAALFPDHDPEDRVAVVTAIAVAPVELPLKIEPTAGIAPLLPS